MADNSTRSINFSTACLLPMATYYLHSVGLDPLSPDSRANVSLNCAALEKDFYQLRPETVAMVG